MMRVIDAPETATKIKQLTVYFCTPGKVMHVKTGVSAGLI